MICLMTFKWYNGDCHWARGQHLAEGSPLLSALVLFAGLLSAKWSYKKLLESCVCEAAAVMVQQYGKQLTTRRWWKTGLLVGGFGAGVAGAEDSAGVVVGEPWTIAPPRRESKRATRNWNCMVDGRFVVAFTFSVNYDSFSAQKPDSCIAWPPSYNCRVALPYITSEY